MASPIDRIKGGLLAFIDSAIGSRVDHLALYPATVAAQNPTTFRVEVIPDDQRVRGTGLSDVPVKTGAPGYRFEVSPGARVLLGFQAGDPSRPYVALWDSEDPSVERVTFVHGIDEAIARETDSTLSGYLFQDAATFIVFYAPDIGGFPGVYLPISGANPNTPFPPPPGTPGVPVTGTITSGNAKLRA